MAYISPTSPGVALWLVLRLTVNPDGRVTGTERWMAPDTATGRLTDGSSAWPLMGALRERTLVYRVVGDDGRAWSFRGAVSPSEIDGVRSDPINGTFHETWCAGATPAAARC